MKNNVVQIADHTPGKITKSADENMWIIRLGEISSDYPDTMPEILSKVMSIRTGGIDVAQVITSLMRELRDIKGDEAGYIEAKNFINQAYDELFPGIPARTSPEIYKRLEGL